MTLTMVHLAVHPALPECAADREQRTCILASRHSEVCRTICPRCRQQRHRDSDSVIVPKGLNRFRASTSRRRKCISVTAAFCFVFIVGGLCPGGAAAPTTSSRQGSPNRMERTKRSDLPTWRNPCGQAFDVDQNGDIQSIDDRAAGKVQNSARNVLEYARDYQDLLAKEKQTFDFDMAMQRTGGIPSTLQQSWYQLPDKALGESLGSPEHYQYALENLPAMYKYLELLIGAMETIPAKSEFSNSDDPDLRKYLDVTINKMTSLLCEFDALLLNRGIRKLKSVEREEVPVRPNEDTKGGLNDFLIFRDTLNFLEIMESVFRHMAEQRQ